MKAPIKYFGGKGTMYKDILFHFPSNETFNIYIETFGGSAAILLANPNFPNVEIYNDLEKNVYSLFKVLSNKALFQEFKEKCDLTYYCNEIRKDFKLSLKNDELTLVDRAYKFFIVNRTSHNGIGGFSINNVIRRGMSKSVSDFLSSIDRLSQLHERLSRVIIENQDAFKLLEKYNQPNVFVYSDPPYHQSTRTTTRYDVDMNNNQQKQFIDLMLNSKAKNLISGYRNSEYERLELSGWKRIDFEKHTVDGKRQPKTVIESLWKNY